MPFLAAQLSDAVVAAQTLIFLRRVLPEGRPPDIAHRLFRLLRYAAPLSISSPLF
jgi:O-antigen/teichoic acid export membrane protein